MKNKKLFIIIGVSFVIGMFIAFMPPARMERQINILAPASVVEATTNRFKTYFDSATVSTYRFDFKAKGDTTQLVWTYIDSNMDDPIVKLFWFFKKDEFQKVMDQGLNDLKSAAEKSVEIK